MYGPAHLLLARWLTPRSPGQARLEYRLAVEQAPELEGYVRPAVGRLIHSYDDATELIPNVPGRAGWIDTLSSTMASRLPAASRRLDDLAVGIDRNDPTIAQRRAEEALADVLAGDEVPWCQGDRRASCLRDGMEKAVRLMTLRPNACSGYAIRARLLLVGGDAAGALKELRTAADGVVDRTHCFEQLADLATLARSEETVTEALERVAHAGCAEDAECVQNLRFVASIEVGRGNDRSALAALQRARARAPGDDGLLEQIAALAARVDLHAESLRAYETLAVHHPDDPRWPAAVVVEKLALVEGAIPY